MISRNELENFKKKFDVVSVFIDHDGETLLLHRQDHKPQGNTWAMVAGKVDKEEELSQALVREIREEIGLEVHESKCNYFEKYYVRYPDFDFLYHVYHMTLPEKPILTINQEEHKDFKWVKPTEALKLNLIPYEDICIKWFYGI
jgi:8-oxo-dGTP diphosphatase